MPRQWRGLEHAYITNAVCHKDCGCCEALLRCACDIGHAGTNDQADHWAEETNNRVAGSRCGSSMGLTASPYHGTASDRLFQ